MKKLKLTIALSFLAAGISGNLSAQDTNTDSHTITISIPKVALVDIEPSATKTLLLDSQHHQRLEILLWQARPIIAYGLTIHQSNPVLIPVM